jgi:hypothetical protein
MDGISLTTEISVNGSSNPTIKRASTPLLPPVPTHLATLTSNQHTSHSGFEKTRKTTHNVFHHWIHINHLCCHNRGCWLHNNPTLLQSTSPQPTGSPGTTNNNSPTATPPPSPPPLPPPQQRVTIELLQDDTAIAQPTAPALTVRCHVHIYDIQRDSSAKNRVVVNGSKQHTDTYTDTTSPVASQLQLRIFLAVTAFRKYYEMLQLDLTNAYLHAPIVDVVYIIIPEGFPNQGQIARLRKAAYGTKQGARRFYDHTALTKIGMKQCSN